MEGLSWLLFLNSLIFCFLKALIATDTLTPIQPIRDGVTLVSSGQIFELGFFSPGDSKFRYLGIWYKNIPLTVVWVANRDKPITGFSGALSISENGSLILLNGNGSIFWSSIFSAKAKNSIAQILDNGNFILKDINSNNTESYIWQSFDYPTNTLLPGMKFGWDMKTGLWRTLTSWISVEDPSPGNYSYSVELHGLPQIVLRMGSKVQYRSGVWYENRFSGRPNLAPNSVFKPIFIFSSEEIYYTYELIDLSIRIRLVMSPTGLLQHFTWNSRQNQWVNLLTIQKDHCDTYNHCGPFGLCDSDASLNCECMNGFTPKSPQEWEVFDTLGGCVRVSPLDCRKGEGFVKFTSMKLPDTLSFSFNSSLGTKDCRAECLKNCSCTGYAELDTDGNGKGCMMWSGDLIDSRKAYNGYGQDLYVRLSALDMRSIADSRKGRRRLKVIIASVVLFVTLLLGLTWWCIMWIRSKKKKIHGGNHVIVTKRCRFGESCEGEDVEFSLFDLATLSTATNHFSSANIMGEGGFGPVYKGVLLTGQEIAVKRLSSNSGQGLKELKNEVLLISKLQHRNLVQLLGCCIRREEMMLVYEFMANRSLDNFIFDEARRTELTWKLRFSIIVGIARGVLYLHRDSRLRIIHRDLKASNVLLDNEMNPKISDFGLARAFRGDQTEWKTQVVAGTYGYMSPEYAVDGNFSVKSDAFSFGVLVLEIVSGMRNREFYHPEHDFNLLGHAWKLWDEEKALELVDESIGDQFSVEEALTCIHVGLLCVQQRPEDRPTMSSVLTMLDGEGPMLDPKQPGFFTERCLNRTDSSSRKRKSIV